MKTLIYVMLLVNLSGCAVGSLNMIVNRADVKNLTWTLATYKPGEEYPNYLSEQEIAEYVELQNRFNEAMQSTEIEVMEKKLREVGYSNIWWAAQIDCRNLIRHLFNIVQKDPGKISYSFYVKSKRGLNGGDYSLSRKIALGTTNYEKMHHVEVCANREAVVQEFYTSSNGYGEYLIGDGTHLLEIWLKSGGDDVKISIKNAEGKPVDTSLLTKEKINSETGLREIARLQEKTRIRIEKERKEAVEESQRRWAERKENARDRREEREANNAAIRGFVKEVSNPNSRIYQNNRMSDQNLEKNYRPKPDRERTGNSYKEYSKPQKENHATYARNKCSKDPKGNWINGKCVYFLGTSKIKSEQESKKQKVGHTFQYKKLAPLGTNLSANGRCLQRCRAQYKDYCKDKPKGNGTNNCLNNEYFPLKSKCEKACPSSGNTDSAGSSRRQGGASIDQ